MTGAAVFPFPDFRMPVLKEEGEDLPVFDIDMVYLLKEGGVIECLQSEDFGGQLLEPVFSKTLDDAAVFISTPPVDKLGAACACGGRLAEVAAAMPTLDLGGEAGDVLSGDRMLPAVA